MIVEGNLEQISSGTFESGNINRVEFIRIDGKRYQNLKYDNYIDTALSNGLKDDGKTSISINEKFNIVTSVKRDNDEVSRIKVFGVLMLGLIFQYGMLFGFGGFLVSGILGLSTESLSIFIISFLAFLTVGIFKIIKTSSTYKHDRDIFGSDT